MWGMNLLPSHHLGDGDLSPEDESGFVGGEILSGEVTL